MDAKTQGVEISGIEHAPAAVHGKIRNVGGTVYLNWDEGLDAGNPIRAVSISMTPFEAAEYAAWVLEIAGAKDVRYTMPATSVVHPDRPAADVAQE